MSDLNHAITLITYFLIFLMCGVLMYYSLQILCCILIEQQRGYCKKMFFSQRPLYPCVYFPPMYYTNFSYHVAHSTTQNSFDDNILEYIQFTGPCDLVTKVFVSTFCYVCNYARGVHSQRL